MVKKDKNLPKHYTYWDNRNYKIGEIDFINDRRDHPHRSFFVDWVAKSSHIKSILEIGPGEMVEYERIVKRKPDIKYSIVDVCSMFINNCKQRYPKVNTYQMPLEQLEGFEKQQFDCIYQASVFEHSPDVIKAIKNCIYVAKEFHFVFFKWKWSGGLQSRYYQKKNLYSSDFNIWKIIDEIKKYGIIECSSVCMNKTGELIPLLEFSKNKGKGKHRSGDYLMIHGKQK